MNNTRLILLVALAAVGLMLWNAWERDQARIAAERTATAAPILDTPAAPTAEPTADAKVEAAEVPKAPSGTTPEPPRAEAAAAPLDAAAPTVILRSDVLELTVSLSGAVVVDSRLLRYRVSAEDEQRVVLLSSAPERYYRAPIGWTAAPGSSAPDHTARYSVAAANFELAAGQDELQVPFSWSDPSGVEVRKIYRLRRGSYAIDLRYEVDNRSERPWEAAIYRQLLRVVPPKPASGFFMTNPETYAFLGAAMYSPTEYFTKLPFDEFASKALDATITDGWTAMMQHHFVAAWIPPRAEPTRFSTRELPASGGLAPRYRIQQLGPLHRVEAGSRAEFGQVLYLGPKLQNELPKVAKGLELTVDYGVFTALSQPLFWLLNWLYRLSGNWGVAIILLTVLVRLALYKLSEAQFKSMAGMKRLAPRIQALQERYGDDRQKLALAQMELFKQEKVNPMGGCLPLLLQIPVFIALYWVIFESVELRQAPFFGWIDDLTAPDPWFLLPILNGLVMWWTQKLSPMTGIDPMQQKIFQAMPVVFAFMFMLFPSGLVLYWTVNGLLGLLQQWYIMKKFGEGTTKKS